MGYVIIFIIRNGENYMDGGGGGQKPKLLKIISKIYVHENI